MVTTHGEMLDACRHHDTLAQGLASNMSANNICRLSQNKFLVLRVEELPKNACTSALNQLRYAQECRQCTHPILAVERP